MISVDLDTGALLAKGLTPNDVVNAVNAQNLVLPSGTAKIGETEYVLATNGSPDTIAGLNKIPVVTRNGATTYLSEVAHVRDGFSPQTNIVRQNGERGVLVSVIKNGGSSTLDIVSALLAQLPMVEQILPKDLKITPLFDQSGFVRAAISGVVREALIAACLTAALILLFLGNWRSTCIIAVSIPLSILSSIIALYLMGETLNIMTLGGLALAVGILVDDATVTIENIERHLHLGSDLHKAILDGAGEIAVPALVSTLCICIVFVPMFFLTGVARYLFAPLAEAVVFAMLASYVLSRTLVPTLVMLMMDHARRIRRRPEPAAARVSRLRRALRENPRRLSVILGRGAGAAPPVRRLLSGLLRAVLLPGVHSRARFLSERRRADKSACTCACPRARASRRRRASPIRWRASSAPSCRRGISARCWTIWGSRSAASTRPYSNSGTFGSPGRRDPGVAQRGSPARRSSTWSGCAANCRGGSPAWNSSSSRPTW